MARDDLGAAAERSVRLVAGHACVGWSFESRPVVGRAGIKHAERRRLVVPAKARQRASAGEIRFVMTRDSFERRVRSNPDDAEPGRRLVEGQALLAILAEEHRLTMHQPDARVGRGRLFAERPERAVVVDDAVLQNFDQRRSSMRVRTHQYAGHVVLQRVDATRHERCARAEREERRVDRPLDRTSSSVRARADRRGR